MFKPLLILLGIISITLALDYSQSNQEVNGFGDDFLTNPEGSNDYLESSIDYNDEMIPNHSDYNEGICNFPFIIKYSKNDYFVKQRLLIKKSILTNLDLIFMVMEKFPRVSL